MSQIKSSTSEASAISSQLKSKALQLSSVAAANTNVPVNQACTALYSTAQAAFPRYQSLMDRDSGFVSKQATNVEQMDRQLASKFK